MFRNRADAGLQLARPLRHRHLHRPVVLAIPCGGLAIGAELARDMGVELDIVLARKLRAPGQPHLALGGISEQGHVELNHFAGKVAGVTPQYLADERRLQMAEIAHLQDVFLDARPRIAVAGRSVILTDDGIATGSTMTAALAAVRAQGPREIIVAVPVASVESSHALERIRARCDDFVCLHSPPHFWGIEEYYADFTPVSEPEAVELLESFRSSAPV